MMCAKLYTNPLLVLILALAPILILIAITFLILTLFPAHHTPLLQIFGTALTFQYTLLHQQAAASAANSCVVSCSLTLS